MSESKTPNPVVYLVNCNCLDDSLINIAAFSSLLEADKAAGKLNSDDDDPNAGGYEVRAIPLHHLASELQYTPQ